MATLAEPITLPPVVAQPHFAITNQVCACGCDIRLPSTIVNRGWQYIRGHKPKVVRVAGRPRKPSKIEHPSQGKSTSMSDVLSFLKAQEKTLVDQEAKARTALNTLDTQRSELTRKLNTLSEDRQKVTEALAQLGSVPAWRCLA